MKTLKGNISEVYQEQVDFLKDQVSYNKNYMKKKVNNLVRLHEAIQEELKTDHTQNKSKFFPWYLINGLKCTVEYLGVPCLNCT